MLGVGVGLSALRPGGDPAVQGLKLGFANSVYARQGVAFASLGAVTGVSFARSGASTARRTDGRIISFTDGAARVTDRGLLIEEARTNLFLRSQELDAASWIKSNVAVTADAVMAPDGTLTADRVASTATTSVAVQQSAIIGATVATASVFVKKGSGAAEANVFRLRNMTTSATLLEVSIDHDGGGVTYVTGASGATLSTAVDGWRRLAMTAVSGVNPGDSLRFDICFVGTAASASAHAAVWGAQLEAGRWASAYAPSVGTAASRGADSLTVAYGLAASADVTECGEVEFTRDTGQTACVVDLHDGGDTNRMHVERGAGGEFRAYVTVAGVSQLIGSLARPGARKVKWALSRTGDRYALVVDGQTAGVTTVVGLPTLTGRRLGAMRGGSAGLNDHLVEQGSIPWAMPDGLMLSRTA
ncbi:MAG: hypothetical protein J0M36_00545 [Caulobacterales bacterium]|nr:hypothetical protein [Caulobacterales bacterium]